MQLAATPVETTDAPAVCIHCDFGLKPVRMKRQWIHHDRSTGQIAVCSKRRFGK